MELSSCLLYSWLCITSECKKRLCGITTAPSTLMIISILPWGISGTTQERIATGQSISTKNNSYRNESPITDTKAMMALSIFLYELEKSIMTTNIVVRTDPQAMGISKSICKAMAPPSISASEVDMEASTALPKMGRDIHLGQYCVAASLRHNPVTMPRWATLCCNTINIMVDRVTTHNNA